jgi:hypothetical protein
MTDEIAFWRRLEERGGEFERGFPLWPSRIATTATDASSRFKSARAQTR